MQYGLGIDLGTTKTAAAVRVDGRVEVVRLGGRRPEIPSLVFVTPDGSLLIGEPAERRGQTEPGRLAREFKRRIGDPVPILAGGVPFSAHALTGKLLRHVLDTVTRLQDGPPAAITVTYPANWGPYKREQLDQAIKIADVGEVALRSEPEAAALQHATARRIAPGETVAVYDLGGGTFDVAVLRREGDGFVLLGEPEGIEQLGGVDFDEAVFGHVIGVLGSKAEGLDPGDDEVVAALTRLRRDCVEAKESLSFDTETMIPVALPGLHTRVRLNRSELEAMIAPSLADTVEATHRALRAAGVTAGELSAVLLAGGSSRIPLVGQLLSTEFEVPVVADPHPEHSIAMGAAVATAGVTGGGSPLASTPRVATRTPPSTNPATTTPAARNPAPATPAARTQAPATTTPAAGAPATPSAGAAPGWAAVPASPSSPVSAAPVSPSPAAFSRGAATVPGTSPAPAPRAAAGSPSVPMNGPDGPPTVSLAASPAAPPWPPAPAPAAGGLTNRRLLMVIALLVALLAGGSAVALVLVRGDKKDKTTATPPSTPVSAGAAAAALPFPTATMLIRVDTGGDDGPARKSSIYLLTPGTDQRTPLPGSVPGDALPKWSRDRGRIALTHVDPDKTSAIYVMNADGSDRHVAVPGGGAAWSADGTKLGFVKKVDGVAQIFVADLATGKQTQLTRAGNIKDDPVWSPDGKSIIYWRARADGFRQIFELNVADPQEPGRAITGADAGSVNDPAPSPDGKQVLYTRQNGTGDTAGYDIWSIGIDGSRPHRLTSDPAREMDPTWSPDGKWFAFIRGALNRPQVVIARADGTGQRTLTQGAAREGHPCWF